MDLETLASKLPPETMAGLRFLAAERDVTPGQVIRELLQHELMRRPAKRPNRAVERLVARLQRLLAPTMAAATSWADLHDRLATHGYELRPTGGGLTLHDLLGARLCKSSELDLTYSRLVKRFAAPMPGHPHRMAHLLAKRAAGDEPDAPLVLIEPYEAD